jgi:hypothetical protein
MAFGAQAKEDHMGLKQKKQPLFPAFSEEGFASQNAPKNACAAKSDPDSELEVCLGKSFATLRGFPNLPAGAVSRHAPEIGHAGECHVNSWAACRGLRPVMVPAGLPFDQLFAVGGHFVRVQTKATVGPAADGTYRFCLTHGNWRTPQGVGPYRHSDFDIAALVFLDLGVVYFTTEKRKTFVFEKPTVHLMAGAEVEFFYECLLNLGLITQEQFEELTPDDDMPCFMM